MKATKSIILTVALMLAAGIVLTFSACEKDTDTDQQSVNDRFAEDYVSGERDGSATLEDLQISPASASVDTIGQKIAFGVRGGKRTFTWSVSDSSSGTVSPTTTEDHTEQVIYTCSALKQNTVICTDSRGRAAVVDITASTPNLTVSPSAVQYLATDMNTPQNYSFTSTGGSTPITWRTDSPSLGTVTSAGGVWTSIADPDYAMWSNSTIKVIATDTEGETASATITFN